VARSELRFFMDDGRCYYLPSFTPCFRGTLNIHLCVLSRFDKERGGAYRVQTTPKMPYFYVLQCVALCHFVLQGNTLQHNAAHCNILHDIQIRDTEIIIIIY